MTDRALVLSGGGLAGIAWETGVLVGIRDGWPGFVDALADPSTMVVGTSAGSAVGSQVAAGVPLDALYESQLVEETAELGAEIDVASFTAMVEQAVAGATSPRDAMRRLGAVAASASTVPASDREEAIRSRLPHPEWPERDLRITAVDIDSGELVVFTRDSGVSLVDAVGASCAVPGVWPVVSIDGRRYMDGGAMSPSNAQVAAGAARVLLLAPMPVEGPGAVDPRELAAVAPAPVEVVAADPASLAAFGANPLDPATRPPAARAGREQGRAVAPRIRDVWG